jgi:glycine/D-amino acid oxidase-like deaminating enzyme/nitrite reductase/ring-hydroxylating ferredoxin subunit
MKSSSWWRDGVEPPSFAPLTRDLSTDVVVVSAGITGLTTALNLARGGRTVVVLESATIGGGTSGHTSAHLTVETDTDLDQLRTRVGEDNAAAAVRANRVGIERIAALDAEMSGLGRFARVPGWLWTDDPSELDRLASMAELYRRYGESAEAPVDVPLPGGRRGMRLDRQGMFHPVGYLAGLARLAAQAEVRIHEGTEVVDWDGGDQVRIAARGGPTVTARELVLATHTPPGMVPSVQTRMSPSMSCLIAVRPTAPFPPGLYWDMADPYHYLRPLDDGRWLLGGEDYKPGTDQPDLALDRLTVWAREQLDLREVTGRWVHMWFEPADGVPYIGRLPLRSHVWVATGFSGTGLTWGTFAAETLADAILHDRPDQPAFSPARLRPLGSADRMVKDQVEVMWHLIGDRLKPAGDLHPADLAPGQGRLVTIDGRKVALYRDDLGALHALNPSCKHMGCVVDWNELDKTWDCPCHGGRYRADGTRFWGPPMGDLEKRRIG